MTRFKVEVVSVQGVGRRQCVFLVETVLCDESAARAAQLIREHPDAAEIEGMPPTAWVYLGREWLSGLPDDYGQRAVRLRSWLAEHAGMAEDDKLVVEVQSIGFLALSKPDQV